MFDASVYVLTLEDMPDPSLSAIANYQCARKASDTREAMRFYCSACYADEGSWQAMLALRTGAAYPGFPDSEDLQTENGRKWVTGLSILLEQPEQFDLGFALIQDAAAHDHLKSAFTMGLLFDLSAQMNHHEISYYEKAYREIMTHAFELGSVEAALSISCHQPEFDQELSRQCMEFALHSKSPLYLSEAFATQKLLIHFLTSNTDLPMNINRMIHLLQSGALLNSPLALLYLSACYQNGLGVLQNSSKANILYQCALQNAYQIDADAETLNILLDDFVTMVVTNAAVG